MASSAPSPIAEQIRQLNDARKHVLLDVKVYSSIVQGILPIIGSKSAPELRRWGADFLAESFATPSLPSRDKETMSLMVLETLRAWVENPNEDIYVVRSAIQTAASIYPLVVRWIINNSYDTTTWDRVTAIKSRILQLWNGELPGIKICCIKFAQRVVLAQTVSIAGDFKRDGLDISLSMVPQGHPLLDPRNLEAEAVGLLDRMLGVLQDNSSDALVVDATLNCLAILIRTRPATSNRIMNAVLNFNPLKLANSPMTPKIRVIVKSMEKTTRMLLMHLIRRDPQNTMNPRIQQHIERLARSRADIFDDNAGRKRALAEQQAAALGDAKRQRLASGAAAVTLQDIPLLPPGPTTLAAVFTLTNTPGLQSFDVSLVPGDLTAKICVSTLARIDQQLLDRSITGVRDRLKALEAAAAQPAVINAATAPLGIDEDDDDDYEPDYYAAEDTEQILNKLDGPSRQEEVEKMEAASLALGAYKLPPPPVLRPEEASNAGRGIVTNVLGMTKQLEESGAKASKAGINRLAASLYDRESWITVITRLATRSSFALEKIVIKDEDGTGQLLGDKVREALFNYVLEDFRKRIDVAISWLSEEWYNDQLQKRALSDTPLHYDNVALRLVDGITPYLHAQDKVLTRFLGEIPEVNPSILERVKGICRDPSLANLAITSLVYLVMMRPPAKDMALDAMQGIWTEYEEARPLAAKFLTRWRKGFLEANSDAGQGGQMVALPAVLAS